VGVAQALLVRAQSGAAGFPAKAQKLSLAQYRILRDSAAIRELLHVVGRRHGDRPVTVCQLGPGDTKRPAPQVRTPHDLEMR